MYNYLFECMFSFILGRYLGVESCLFLEEPPCFSTAAAPFYIFTNNVQGFPFFHILINTCFHFFFFFFISYSAGCELKPCCGFDTYFPKTNDGEHHFMCLLAIYIFPLGKYQLKTFAQYSIGLSFFVVKIRILYIIWILIPYQIYDLHIFSILWVVFSVS